MATFDFQYYLVGKFHRQIGLYTTNKHEMHKNTSTYWIIYEETLGLATSNNSFQTFLLCNSYGHFGFSFGKNDHGLVIKMNKPTEIWAASRKKCP